jgi:ABC-type sugar transport system permease subunit
MLWGGFPGNMILWAGTLARIPDSVIEYGRMEGISWLREIWQIIIPLVWPTFVLLFITMWAGFFSASGAVFLLTGGGYGTQTLSNWMYMKVYSVKQKYSNAYTYLAAFGMMLSVVAATISLSVRHIANKFNAGVEY